MISKEQLESVFRQEIQRYESMKQGALQDHLGKAPGEGKIFTTTERDIHGNVVLAAAFVQNALLSAAKAIEDISGIHLDVGQNIQPSIPSETTRRTPQE